MMDSIRLQDFGGFVDTLIKLHPRVTLLVGRNGSGKSTVLDALASFLAKQVRPFNWFLDEYPHVVPARWDIRQGADSFAVHVTMNNEIHQMCSGPRVALNFVQNPLARRDWDGPPTGTDPPFYLIQGVRFPNGLDPTSLAPGAPKRAEALLSPCPEPTVADRATLVRWFMALENVENELRLAGDPAHRNSILEVVRGTLTTFLGHLDSVAYSSPRISRVNEEGQPHDESPEGVLMLTKGEVNLPLLRFSQGEQAILCLVMDLARRLALWHGPANAVNGDAILLVDEIEEHLHPGWQRRVIPALLETFPGLQLIATTHSPQVLGSVSAESVRLLHDFQVHASPPTEGRDSNSLLEEVFDVPERSAEMAIKLEAVGDLLDADRLDEARKSLDLLREALTESDPEVSRLAGMLAFLAS